MLQRAYQKLPNLAVSGLSGCPDTLALRQPDTSIAFTFNRFTISLGAVSATEAESGFYRVLSDT